MSVKFLYSLKGHKELCYMTGEEENLLTYKIMVNSFIGKYVPYFTVILLRKFYMENSEYPRIM